MSSPTMLKIERYFELISFETDFNEYSSLLLSSSVSARHLTVAIQELIRLLYGGKKQKHGVLNFTLS